MGTALDPDGLVAGTREVMAWAAERHPSNGTWEARTVAAEHGSEPVEYRKRLLDAWSIASAHEHARLRTIYPAYAGPMLMWQQKGLAGVVEFFSAISADVADLGVRRRQSYRAPAL